MTQYHRVCCCDAGDCCDVWACRTQNLSHVVITYSFEIVRTFANGQSFTVREGSWSLEGDMTYVSSGTNCNNWFYKVGELDMSFSTTWRHLLPDTIDDSAPYSPGPGIGSCSSTLPAYLQPCSGCSCDDDGRFVCDLDLVYCVTAVHDWSWTGTVQRTGKQSDRTLIIGCTEDCGCVRPYMELRPAGYDAFTEITNAYTIDYQCCDATSDVSTTWTPTWTTTSNAFEFLVLGTCLCMDENAFADPVIATQTGGGADVDAAFGAFPFAGVGPSDIEPGECVNTTCGDVIFRALNKGSFSYTWTCQYYEDGSPVVNNCHYTMAYTDTCTTTWGVVFT
jgi:hypothetical protein